MPLLTVDEYIKRRYTEESRPPKHRIWRYIRKGRLDPWVHREGKQYYIDEKALELTHDPLVDKVLCG